jgi:hypothetical protein
MSRTQIKNDSIANETITGASVDPAMNIYNETKTYSTDEVVVWKTDTWVATASIPATTEGDLQYAPETNTNWKKITPIKYNVYPSTSQTFANADAVVTIDTERATEPFSRITLDATNHNIVFNISGDIMLSYDFSAESTTANRSISTTRLEISTDGGTNWATIQNTTGKCYHRTTAAGATSASILIPLNIGINDRIRMVTIASSSDNLQTIPTACNITVFTTLGVSGPKGDKGDVGASGDIDWKGPYDSGTTYNTNDAVEYLGTSYVSIADNNTETPSDTATNWDILAKKGDAGAGSSIVVADEGTNLPNSPHTTLNFTGDIVTATDSGSGVAEINIVPKYEYIQVIWAEENAALGAGNYEWAFGNGANTPLHYGCPIYVPSGYTAEIVALGLIVSSSDQTVNATVQCEVTDSSNTTYNVGSVAVDYGGTGINRVVTELSTPYTVGDAYSVNFKTTSVSGTSNGPNVATAYIKFKQT